MTLDFSREKLTRALPDVRPQDAETFFQPLYNAMQEFKINTPLRMAAFLSQIAHESGSLRYVRENLNYSAEALMRVWPKYFPSISVANQYARKPEDIANTVYANRMGNGDRSSGDGWRYRGRGLIQLTGKSNYERCGAALKRDLVADPSYLETPEGASRSAAWFWSFNGINELADRADVLAITKRINGGYNGIEDRQAKYSTALRAFGGR